MKSEEGREETSILFVNEMNEAADVYWLDYDGQRRFWFMLKPGEEREQVTYVTHPWLVLTSGDATFVALIVGVADEQTIMVRGPEESEITISSHKEGNHGEENVDD